MAKRESEAVRGRGREREKIEESRGRECEDQDPCSAITQEERELMYKSANPH